MGKLGILPTWAFSTRSLLFIGSKKILPTLAVIPVMWHWWDMALGPRVFISSWPLRLCRKVNDCSNKLLLTKVWFIKKDNHALNQEFTGKLRGSKLTAQNVLCLTKGEIWSQYLVEFQKKIKKNNILPMNAKLMMNWNMRKFLAATFDPHLTYIWGHSQVALVCLDHGF